MRISNVYQKLRPYLKAIPLPMMVLAIGLLMPHTGFCTVEDSLSAIQYKLTTAILPAAAILGLIFAGLSFVAGSPNARTHLTLAIMGAAIGFGATSIVNFIREMVH